MRLIIGIVCAVILGVAVIVSIIQEIRDGSFNLKENWRVALLTLTIVVIMFGLVIGAAWGLGL